MAERADTRQLHIPDCETISRRLSDLLDEADPIESEYRLEVSSPGIDRPLTRPQDYADWVGHVARIRLLEPQDGRKQFEGKLLGLDDDHEIERQSCRDRVCLYVLISWVAISLTKKNNKQK